MHKWIEAVPAYGRDYTTQKQVRDAWKAGNDFRDAESGKYFNIESMKLPEMENAKILVRYSKFTKVVSVN